MMTLADLHLHTCFSDGTYTPEELAVIGRQKGLGVLAITDHDTVDGCPRMAAACQREGIEFIPGIEITTGIDEREVHILAYGVDISNPPLLEALQQFQQIRQNRVREIVERLKKLGIALEAETVFELANCSAPGRPHVGRALVGAGVCANLDEAFERFLKRNRPAWVPKPRINAAEAIELIHEARGLAVLAHPGINHADEVIPKLVASGLDGIECFHTRHSPAVTEHYLAMSEQLGLVATGGSDCHGMNKGQPLIGGIKLPYTYVSAMKERLAARRNGSSTTIPHTDTR